ncbi:MAG: extracellular solute-binding protein, partial [Spirochaetota bacterium]
DGYLVDPKTYTYAPDKNAMAAIDFLLDLVSKEKVAPSKKSMGSFRQQDVFPQGKAAMWVDGSWNIANVRNVAGDKFRWGIAAVPKGPNGTADAVNGWADFFVIGRDTKAPDQAWQFIKYAISEGAMASDALLAGKIPVYKPYAEKLKNSSKGQPEEFNKIFSIAAGDIRSTFTKGWSEWRGYGPAESMGLNGAVDGIIDGEFERGAALAEVAENANAALARHYKK